MNKLFFWHLKKKQIANICKVYILFFLYHIARF